MRVSGSETQRLGYSNCRIYLGLWLTTEKSIKSDLVKIQRWVSNNIGKRMRISLKKIDRPHGKETLNRPRTCEIPQRYALPLLRNCCFGPLSFAVVPF